MLYRSNLPLTSILHLQSIRGTSALVPPNVQCSSSLSLGAASHHVPMAEYQPSVISISDAYDSGNGEFVSAEVVKEEDVDVRVVVRMKKDP